MADAANLTERLFGATIAALDLLHVYVGDKLGLYRALADSGPLEPAGLAGAAGIDERYAREWLEQQAVARIVEVDSDGRFSLPADHREVLLDTTSLAYFAPAGKLLMGLARAMPEVLDAFRKGGGVPYTSYGDDIREAISHLNRPMFLNQLGAEWFPAMTDIDARLRTAPPARVADVGCGTGWSTLAIAVAYPSAQVVGIDLDDASIATARENAMDMGLADRVEFMVRDAADPDLAGTFDLVCAFETIHDMCDPIGALRAMRALRGDGGAVLVVDERVADEFTVDVDDMERFQWGFSALHCMPCALTDPPAAGTGTIMRAPTFREYAKAAGYASVDIAPIEHDFWRFYRLKD
ncbi:MAG: class I SAM-dependent methyltransferase [Actinomycetota bacterium]